MRQRGFKDGIERREEETKLGNQLVVLAEKIDYMPSPV